MNSLFLLFIEFFKIGLFAIGGGLATIPFLIELSNRYHWFTIEMLSNMIAVSESTPGPIGVNMATYVGFHTYGILGGIITTIGLVTPSVIVICIIAKILKKFKESNFIQSIFYGLRPAVSAMVVFAAFGIFQSTLFHTDLVSNNPFDYINYIAVILFILCFFIYRKYTVHPIVMIFTMAITGIILQL